MKLALVALLAGACEDRSYRQIGADIQVLATRTDALVAAARERLARFKRQAIPQIETALHTASTTGKLNLIGALEVIRDEEAVPILRHFAIYDVNKAVRAACESVLRGWAVGEGARGEAARTALVRVSAARPSTAAATATATAEAQVMIVADEIPAMQTLGRELASRAGAKSTIVTQDRLPSRLDEFAVVIVYIHGDLSEPAENAFIGYAERGGKLLLLHHSISSGKRKNKRWFDFLGVTLPTGEAETGGYQYYDSTAFDLVNLAPREAVTRTKTTYPKTVPYARNNARPAFSFDRTEVYVNHVLRGPRTILFGLHYTDAKTGRVFDQDIAGWSRPAAKGQVYYFMPGHRAEDFENPVYAQVLANVVTARR